MDPAVALERKPRASHSWRLPRSYFPHLCDGIGLELVPTDLLAASRHAQRRIQLYSVLGSSDSLGAWPAPGPALAIRRIRGSISQLADNSHPWHSVKGCPADEPVSLLGPCLVVLCASQLLDGGTSLLDAVSPELASRRVPRTYLCPGTWGHGPQHPRFGLS